MNKTFYVGFGYKAQVGKDTAAKYLCEKYSAYRVAFADPLRDAARAIFGWTNAHMLDTKFKEEVSPYWNMSPRQSLKLLGTEVARTFEKDIWIKRLQQRTVNHLGSPKLVGIPDVRYINEAKFCKDNGILIKINRMTNAPETGHQSEVELDNYTDWDYVIDNNGSYKDLHEQLDQIMKDHQIKIDLWIHSPTVFMD